MEIELSESLEHYKETIALGLTAKQFLFSVLSVGTGALIILLLYKQVGLTVSCYIATPVVIPLAMGGFYNYHGLTFWQFLHKMIHFTFFNRPLIYASTENVVELMEAFMAGEKEKAEKEQTGKEGKSNMRDVKRKAVLLIAGVLVALAAIAAAAVWWKAKRLSVME